MFNPLDVALHANTETHKRKVQEEIDSKKKVASVSAATSDINGASIDGTRVAEMMKTHLDAYTTHAKRIHDDIVGVCDSVKSAMVRIETRLTALEKSVQPKPR